MRGCTSNDSRTLGTCSAFAFLRDGEDSDDRLGVELRADRLRVELPLREEFLRFIGGVFHCLVL